MGGKISKIIDNAQLVPQQTPLVAHDPKFAVQQSTHLLLSEKGLFETEDFVIKNIVDNTEWFKLIYKFSLSDKKTLFDMAGEPVANIKNKGYGLRYTLSLFKGGDSTQLICKFEFKEVMGGIKANATLQNQATNQQVPLNMYGDWYQRRAVIFIGDPETGGQAIARISKEPAKGILHALTKKKGYMLEIVPGVDIALMVMFCLATDQFHEHLKAKQKAKDAKNKS
ncbi:tubby C-terminal-like domain-containing protein [Globomyces pollinis-pini]|nr:tubby C-terminal-like domain-containing protein [Globomyces pollinis-pini]